MATKSGRVVTYNEELLFTKSHDFLITWSSDFDFPYTICSFRTKTPNSLPISCSILLRKYFFSALFIISEIHEKPSANLCFVPGNHHLELIWDFLTLSILPTAHCSLFFCVVLSYLGKRDYLWKLFIAALLYSCSHANFILCMH